MIPTLLAIALALYWLMLETDWLRVRLPMGRAITPQITPLAPELRARLDALVKEMYSNQKILPAPKLLTAPTPRLQLDVPHFRDSEFTPLDMPDSIGSFQILCVREAK